jgi:hypothetical protein
MPKALRSQTRDSLSGPASVNSGHGNRRTGCHAGRGSTLRFDADSNQQDAELINATPAIKVWRMRLRNLAMTVQSNRCQHHGGHWLRSEHRRDTRWLRLRPRLGGIRTVRSTYTTVMVHGRRRSTMPHAVSPVVVVLAMMRPGRVHRSRDGRRWTPMRRDNPLIEHQSYQCPSNKNIAVALTTLHDA